MRCTICNKNMDTTFMEKIVGTYVKKPGSKKTYPICPECQHKFTTKEQLVANLK